MPSSKLIFLETTMPEIVNIIYNATSAEDLKAKLEEMKFEPLVDVEIGPTIRRICDRAVSDESKLDQMVYGVVTDEKGRREYCGVSVDDLKLVVVHRDWVKKRRDRYQAFPLPTDPERRSRDVQRLIFEVVEKWSSSNPNTLGASYAQIYYHVADFSNIELDEARALVDEELPKLDYLEKSKGDHWRIKPVLLVKPSRGELLS